MFLSFISRVENSCFLLPTSLSPMGDLTFFVSLQFFWSNLFFRRLQRLYVRECYAIFEFGRTGVISSSVISIMLHLLVVLFISMGQGIFILSSLSVCSRYTMNRTGNMDNMDDTCWHWASAQWIVFCLSNLAEVSNKC